MEQTKEEHPTVLAVSVDKHGIGFAIFEDVDSPVDWGTRAPRFRRQVNSERNVEALISFYQPDILVLRHTPNAKNRQRAHKVTTALVNLGAIKGLEVVEYEWEEVQDTFEILAGVRKSYAIAKKIVEYRPELKIRQPKYRKPWEVKAFSMGMFEAFALAITYYHKNT